MSDQLGMLQYLRSTLVQALLVLLSFVYSSHCNLGAPPTPSFLPPNESDFEIFEGSVNVTVRWSEPQDYRHTTYITSYNITANCTMSSQGSSWVETLTVQDSQKMMTFPVGTVATLIVHADVCDSLVSNESKALELCIEGEGCFMVCVCV